MKFRLKYTTRTRANGRKLRMQVAGVGKLVVLFRSTTEGDVDPYHKELQGCGYVPVSIPVLSFQFDNQKELAEKMQAPESHGGLILTSQRAVEAMAKAAPQEAWKDRLLKAWQELPVFVVGKSTSKTAREKLGFESFIGEETGGAEKLLPVICGMIGVGSKPLLYPCGKLRRDTIPDGLADAGIELSSVQVYSTCADSRIQESLCELLDKQGSPSYIVFFSPSGVDFTADILRTMFCSIEDVKMIAIGGTTSKALKQKGWNVAAVAEQPNAYSLAQCIVGCNEVEK